MVRNFHHIDKNFFYHSSEAVADNEVAARKYKVFLGLLEVYNLHHFCICTQCFSQVPMKFHV